MPFVLPGWVINRASRARLQLALLPPAPARACAAGSRTRSRSSIPLDVIRHWNRLYGPRGFTQYQCVLPGAGRPRRGAPLPGAAHRPRRRLDALRDQGLRGGGAGLLSFPRPGISIALDIPIRDDTQALVDALNELVIAEGGRVYLAKDAFTRPSTSGPWSRACPSGPAIRRQWDPEGRLRSAQSVRLLGDRP